MSHNRRNPSAITEEQKPSDQSQKTTFSDPQNDLSNIMIKEDYHPSKSITKILVDEIKLNELITHHDYRPETNFLESRVFACNHITNIKEKPIGHIPASRLQFVSARKKNSLHPTELWRSAQDNNIEFIVKKIPEGHKNNLHIQIEAANAALAHLMMPEYTPQQTFILYDDQNNSHPIIGLAVRKFKHFTSLSDTGWKEFRTLLNIYKETKNSNSKAPIFPTIKFLARILTWAYLTGEDDFHKGQYDIVNFKILDFDMLAWELTRHFKGERFNDSRDMTAAFQLSVEDIVRLPFYTKAEPNYSPAKTTNPFVCGIASIAYDDEWSKKQYTAEDSEVFNILFKDEDFIYEKYKTCLLFIILDKNILTNVFETHIDKTAHAEIDKKNKTVIQHYVNFFETRIQKTKEILLNTPQFLSFLENNRDKLLDDFKEYTDFFINPFANNKNIFSENPETLPPDIYIDKLEERFKTLYNSLKFKESKIQEIPEDEFNNDHDEGFEVIGSSCSSGAPSIPVSFPQNIPSKPLASSYTVLNFFGYTSPSSSQSLSTSSPSSSQLMMAASPPNSTPLTQSQSPASPGKKGWFY